MVTGLEKMTDEHVEQALLAAVRAEAKSTAVVIRALIEFGERRHLYRRRACPSLFEYCTTALGYSEDAAYKRLRVARAAQDCPKMLDLLDHGRTDLSKLVVIAPYLTCGRADELLEKACSLSKRDVEFYVAGLAPKAITKDNVRFLSVHAVDRQAGLGPVFVAHPPTSDTAAPPMPHNPPNQAMQVVPPVSVRVEPVTQELARISVTVDRETVHEYDRACKLLRVRRADGGRVFARAIKTLLAEIDPEVRLAKKRPAPVRPSSPEARRVPQHVREAVWKRDGGRCAFKDDAGQRCSARVGLQFDHVRP